MFPLQVQETNAEINQLVEKSMLAGDPTDDKQSLFRQQATIISRKKESAAEALREARDELQKMTVEIQEKREAASQGDGEEVLKGDEVRRKRSWKFVKSKGICVQTTSNMD